MDGGVTYSSGHAVDGLPHTFSHTYGEQLPYWWVDLETIYIIMRIELINRNYDGKYGLH